MADYTSSNQLTDAEQTALAAYSDEVRQHYTRVTEDIRKEFRSGLDDVLNRDIKGFISEAKKALAELTPGSADSGLGAQGANLGSHDFALDLFGTVLGGVLNGKKLNRKQLANNVAQELMAQFFPQSSGYSRGRQSRSQAASALMELFSLGQRNL